ncbi:MAG TPA: hypothetical protein VKV27_08880 [Solirubrobacteraceae bacterium]|nr:hypothetical protein [Solirubrobacteraceae bacterium]
MPDPVRVLIVAHQTATTPALLDCIRERARRGPVSFHLLVPRRVHGLQRLVDPEDATDEEAAQVLEQALPVLSEAAGQPVTGSIGVAEPLAAIQDAVNLQGFDEIVISTLPPRLSRWLRLDLVSKARGLGLPVTHVESRELAVA